MVGCSFIYSCWTCTSCCILLMRAETKQVRQLKIHWEILSSINMVITGISRAISQLLMSPHQEKVPPKIDCRYFKNSPALSLRSCRVWMFLLRTSKLSLTYLEVFTWKQHISFKMGQVPPCSGIRRSVSCLFWSTTPAKLCGLFRAVLRTLIPGNLLLGMFIRMTLICGSE